MARGRSLVWALALGAAGCGGGGLPPLVLPVGLAPAPEGEARTWAASTRPPDNREIRFHWQFRDESGAASGRGRVRLALPDSVRFDVAGPLGSGSSAAFVQGDTAVWAEPEDKVRKLVPNYPLFWAMLGIARAPAPGQSVRRIADGTVMAWQFTGGGDTVEYVREAAPAGRLIAEVRQQGRRIGRVETRFGPEGLPATSRLVVENRPARLDLTFNQNTKARPFAADTWTRPAPGDR